MLFTFSNRVELFANVAIESDYQVGNQYLSAYDVILVQIKLIIPIESVNHYFQFFFSNVFH